MNTLLIIIIIICILSILSLSGGLTSLYFLLQDLYTNQVLDINNMIGAAMTSEIYADTPLSFPYPFYSDDTMLVIGTPIVKEARGPSTVYTWNTDTSSNQFSAFSASWSEGNDLPSPFYGSVSFLFINESSFHTFIDPDIMKCGSINKSNVEGQEGRYQFSNPFPDNSNIIVIAGLNGSNFDKSSLASVRCYDVDSTGFNFIKTYASFMDQSITYNFAITDFFSWIAINLDKYNQTNNSAILQAGMCSNDTQFQDTFFFPRPFTTDQLVVVTTVNASGPGDASTSSVVSVTVSEITKNSFVYTKKYAAQESGPQNLVSEPFFWLAIDPSKIKDLGNIFVSK
ncbi:MAG: hypothetical protein EBU93_07100 [Chlamydiae bacterium]|nr:hypothetical protein [Chlamydiota bacterium]